MRVVVVVSSGGRLARGMTGSVEVSTLRTRAAGKTVLLIAVSLAWNGVVEIEAASTAREVVRVRSCVSIEGRAWERGGPGKGMPVQDVAGPMVFR